MNAGIFMGPPKGPMAMLELYRSATNALFSGGNGRARDAHHPPFLPRDRGRARPLPLAALALANYLQSEAISLALYA